MARIESGLRLRLRTREVREKVGEATGQSSQQFISYEAIWDRFIWADLSALKGTDPFYGIVTQESLSLDPSLTPDNHMMCLLPSRK